MPPRARLRRAAAAAMLVVVVVAAAFVVAPSAGRAVHGRFVARDDETSAAGTGGRPRIRSGDALHPRDRVRAAEEPDDASPAGAGRDGSPGIAAAGRDTKSADDQPGGARVANAAPPDPAAFALRADPDIDASTGA